MRELEVQLAHAREQLAATGAILRVIADSPGAVEPVLDAMLASASRLCHAIDVAVLRVVGDELRWAAGRGPLMASVPADLRIPLTRGSVASRAVVDRATVHVLDFLAEPDAEYPVGRELARRFGHRAMLAVPLLREGVGIGVICAFRFEARAFSPQHIELLETFAAQAVIAIENVRLFHELEQKSRELEAASRHKSEFLANMSHELRTPLNAVIGFSEVLTERMFGDLNEKQDEYLRDIFTSGQHLLALINDILDLSKIEAGRMELELSDFELPMAVDNALMLVRERAGRRGIALAQSIGDGVGPIRADERKVRQVLLNLLSNALKFTPEGGRVAVAATARDKTVEVSVADTGVGIAPEDQEAVFEEFRQVGTASQKIEGTGLGLTLCRKFVELHGGRIWVRSELGQGATFTFSLPLGRES